MTNVTLECVKGPSAGSLAGTLLRLLLPLSEEGERNEKNIHLTPRWFLFFPGSNDEGDIQSTSAPNSKSCLVCCLPWRSSEEGTIGRGRREEEEEEEERRSMGEEKKEKIEKKEKKRKKENKDTTPQRPRTTRVHRHSHRTREAVDIHVVR